MNFLEAIFQRLEACRSRPMLREARPEGLQAVTGGELLGLVARARAFLRSRGLQPGDRVALLAPNSIRWIAVDLALMAERLIVVPLYSRQAPAELAVMMQDCSPALLLVSGGELLDSIRAAWPQHPPAALFDQIFAASAAAAEPPAPREPSQPATIIYTSGTSGVPKGVVLNTANLDHMLPCTLARLDALMQEQSSAMPEGVLDRVYHYLPFNFAGSWILLLTSLLRGSRLTLNTDLNRIADDLKLVAPHYFLNVPALLERVRRGIEEQVSKRGGVAQFLFEHGMDAYFRRCQQKPQALDALWLALARSLVFHAIRQKLGPQLRALICGSAPLAVETQLFFMMLGIPVLQVYGLTETTAICTMDDPTGPIQPGRVGPAVSGIEMRLGESDEILVRGPNIFPGYWNRPQESAAVLRDGWFHTGDQGEVNERGNWRIIGRVKNLIVLASGHNVPPEPIEEAAARAIPGAQQVLLVGHARSYLAAIITGEVKREEAEAALAALNQELPHYRRIHRFHISPQPFTIENGLLTANGKLRRDAIMARFAEQIEELYSRRDTEAWR